MRRSCRHRGVGRTLSACCMLVASTRAAWSLIERSSCTEAVSLAPKAGQDKAGRLDFPHFAIRPPPPPHPKDPAVPKILRRSKSTLRSSLAPKAGQDKAGRLDFPHFAIRPPPPTQRTPPYQKYYAVVNLLCVVHVPHSDLLSRRTLCGHRFPANYRHFSSQGRVYGVVNMGGGG